MKTYILNTKAGKMYNRQFKSWTFKRSKGCYMVKYEEINN